MMKQYVYEKRSFFKDVKLTSWFCIAIMFVALYFMMAGVLPPIMGLMFVVAFYTVWNTYISHSNPETIHLDEEGISFASFNREDHYPFQEIKEFRVREFPNTGKMYVRINNAGLCKGRYWIQTQHFSDGKELFAKILAKEEELNPDSLKTRARKGSEAYHKHNTSTHGTRKSKHK